jgi:hypothetical protein
MIQNTVRPLLQYLLLVVTKHFVIGLCRVILEIFFNFHWSLFCNNVLIYIQQDATLHNLFYVETALHVSGGTTNHHQERKQLYLQHLVFITPLLLLATISGR